MHNTLNTSSVRFKIHHVQVNEIATFNSALFCLSTLSLAQREGFNVRYLGGSVETKTSKDDWNNKLTIHSDEILITASTPSRSWCATKTRVMHRECSNY